MSADYKKKNTTYTVAVGLDKLNLFAAFDAEVEVGEYESAGANGSININVFIPIAIIAVVASSPVSIPVGVMGLLSFA